MLAPFLIMLRDGIEAALITGIIASYLVQTGRAAWISAIWLGILLAIAFSLFVGAGLQFISGEFPQKQQEMFEAAVGLIAVSVLVSMVFWMRKAGRFIKSQLHQSIDHAFAGTGGTAWPLVGMAFFAVAREGLEAVFFLLAVFQQSTGPAAPLGALAGLLCAIAVGYLIFTGGVHLDLRRFFRWTGIFILVVAAGLLAGAVRRLHEAGVWNGLQQPVYDLSQILPETSILGTVLSGFFNYQEAPVLGEVLAYAGFLAVSLFLFLRPYAPAAGATANLPEAKP